MSFDYIIAGSGFSGGVIARKLAEDGKKVLILERRNHIAGNMYDEIDDNGILIQKYGPHIFHTNSNIAHDFIQKYSTWNTFKLKCTVQMKGILVPSPFNFTAIDLLYNEKIANKLKKTLGEEYPSKSTITIDELLKSDNNLILEYAKLLFDLDYLPYTAKQWGVAPEQIDINILRRVPIRLDYQDGYFDDEFECMPHNGFTHFFNTLLDHDNIEIKLNSDILPFLSFNEDSVSFNGNSNTNIVFTGPVDELFAYKYGRLPYRSLKFDYQNIYMDSFQPTPVVAYPLAPGYTRITEYSKLPRQNSNGVTTIAVEFPIPFDENSNSKVEPYYPIINEKNNASYQNYSNESSSYKNLFLCGRLANYRYYNMDQAILNALNTYEIIKGRIYENN